MTVFDFVTSLTFEFVLRVSHLYAPEKWLSYKAHCLTPKCKQDSKTCKDGEMVVSLKNGRSFGLEGLELQL